MNRIRTLLRHPFLLTPWVVYALTTATTVGLPDSAVIHNAMRAFTQADIVNPWAPHAWNHPLTNLLGSFCLTLLPGDNPFWKVNFYSTLCGSTALCLFYWALIRLGAARWPATLTSAAFMVSQSMWWHSVWVESYALSAVFLLACLHTVISSCRAEAPLRSTTTLMFLSTFATFNHLQNGALALTALSFLAWRTMRLAPEVSRQRWFAWTLGGLLLGSIPYLTVVGIHMMHTGWSSTLDMATGGPFRALFGDYGGVPGLIEFGHLLFLQFPSGWVLVGLFCLMFYRPHGQTNPPNANKPALLFLTANLSIQLVVFLGYRTWDQYAFLLQVFVILALLAGLGVAKVFTAGRPSVRWASSAYLVGSIILPLFLYPRISFWSRDAGGYWAGRYGKISADYKARYDLTGLLVDPLRKDRGSLKVFQDELEGWVREITPLNPGIPFFTDEASWHTLWIDWNLFFSKTLVKWTTRTGPIPLTAVVEGFDLPKLYYQATRHQILEWIEDQRPRTVFQLSTASQMKPFEAVMIVAGYTRHPLRRRDRPELIYGYRWVSDAVLPREGIEKKAP